MSEEKVHGTTQESELKNSDGPNKFATSVGYLLTRSNPERAVGEAIDQLISERQHWENHELANSNETLYALLQHCYSLNNAMSGSDFTAKALRKGLANYIQQKGYQFKESSPLITKIVKCVFGVNRRRVNAYSSALRVAIAERVAVMNLPKFFKDKGGIEEVRRQATTGKAKTMKDKVELGRAVLESNVLAKIQSDTLNKNFSNDSLEEGVVLLATREDDGSFAIRRVVQSNAAVKSALAACASVGQDKEKAKQFEDEQRAIEAERLAVQAALKAA
ncbi:MAG: hypothetical protein NTX67_03130 [Burkholderiales bacterium]|jgi:hypothetical protein|nr:hypothetical protein [Burkholderiales bacterium]